MDDPGIIWREPPTPSAVLPAASDAATTPAAIPAPPPPAIAAPPPPAAISIEQHRLTNRRGGIRRQVAAALAISLLSAGLASTATVVALAPSLGSGSSAPSAAPAGAGTVTGARQAITVSTSGATASPATSDDSVVTAVEKASPSVVTITTAVTSASRRGAVSGTGVGSGVIYTTNGYILTNNHVVEGGTAVKVTLSDGTAYDATVVKTDAADDLAVIRIDASGLTAATIGDSSAAQIGETVIAIGSPLGDYTNSVTTGVLSGIGRTITVADELTGQPRTLTNLLQTDAAINPGNSGGPLLDTTGAVIGLDAASDSSAQGIGFAIPINAAKALMSEAQVVA